MLYLVVAQTYLSKEDEAKQTEAKLYKELTKRITFDDHAKRSLNHLRLKANMLNSSEVAAKRILDAINFFNGQDSADVYDPIYQFIGFVNLSANKLQSGKFLDAFDCTNQAEKIVRTEVGLTFPRYDILLSNMAISGYLSRKLELKNAKDLLIATLNSPQRKKDPLFVNNYGYILALEGNFTEAIEIIKPVFYALCMDDDIDSYFLYFLGNNLAGCFYMRGIFDESINIWKLITPFVKEFVGPIKHYIKKRHDLQGKIFECAENIYNWHEYIKNTSGPQVGTGWDFFGTGYLASDIEFWSDE